ncbi:hypothetical protein Syun_011040 [Stephania yunnanensis]|uniref:Protein arginine N-methyltransferase PRMT10 n=1 Tax=Stephania yunnanensis TaxID=152371 RepID=A0AAP0PHU9_9MAGN
MDRSGVNGVSSSGGARTVDKGVDFANYFCTYAFLYHQKEMLCDRVRMDAYFNSIFQNKHHFHSKTVLDVGTGSGILAIWSAQAGAKKVYAVEATKMADHARELVKANGLEDVVEAVDVIISEWMGYFLLRESMFDSVIYARDKWLKPTGIIPRDAILSVFGHTCKSKSGGHLHLRYPSHARMWVAPIRSGLGDQKMGDYEAALDDWYRFLDETNKYYGVDMKVLTKPYCEEQKKYYLQARVPAVIKDIDCLTATVDDILYVRANFTSLITMDMARFSGFAGWFDVHFRGSRDSPATQEIELTTAPSVDDGTHWGQQVFLLHPPCRVEEGDNLSVSFSMNRSKENHRLMEVEFGCEIRQQSEKQPRTFTKKFYIE